MSRSLYIVPFLIGGTMLLLTAIVVVLAVHIWMSGIVLTWWLLGVMVFLACTMSIRILYLGMEGYDQYWAETPLDGSIE